MGQKNTHPEAAQRRATHDINNQLAIIIGNAQLLIDELGAASEHMPRIDKILRAANEIAQLTRS